MEIIFKKRQQIDDKKWNETIRNSNTDLPYAYTFFLDIVAPNWGAFLVEDYSAVMPLPYRNYIFLKSLYQPLFCQQLGVFQIEKNKAQCDLFLEKTTLFFGKKNYNFNFLNEFKNTTNLQQKTNLILPLSETYETIAAKYNTNTKRNIKKAIENKLVANPISIADIADFFIKNTAKKDASFKPKHQQILQQLLQLENFEFIAATIDGRIFAIVGIYHNDHRKLAIFNSSNDEGKKNGASHFLFDFLIKKYANTNTTFDFEGSNIASIAQFYKAFGAIEQNYFAFQK